MELQNKIPSLKELLDFHEEFVKGLPKCNDIIPQVIVSKNGEAKVFVVVGGRDEIKRTLLLAQNMKPDWIVTINEAYMKKADSLDEAENHVHGTLEKEFKAGNSNVMEIVTICAYRKDGKLQRNLNKMTNENLYGDMENFAGFLTIDDVERVYW